MEEVQRGAPAGDWLSGAAAVAVLTFELEISSSPGDLTSASHEAYGARVGIPRLLELLGHLETSATFFVPGIAADRYPHALQSIAMAGHEIALRGHAGTRLADMDADAQQADLESGLTALQALGHRVSGYRAPDWHLTARTLELLGAARFAYDSSLMDDDRPYRMRLRTGVLAELPVHWALDDRAGHTIDGWADELDAMRSTHSLCVLTCRPAVTGRPGPLRRLARFITAARADRDVRFARAHEVAANVLGVTAEA